MHLPVSDCRCLNDFQSFYMSVCPAACLSISLSGCVGLWSIIQSVCLFLSVYVRQSPCFFYLSVNSLSNRVFVFLFVCPSSCLSASLSVCLSVRLMSVYPYVCVFVRLSLSVNLDWRVATCHDG